MLKMISATLGTALLCTMLTGCNGSSSNSGSNANKPTRPPPPTQQAPGGDANDVKQQGGARTGTGATNTTGK